MENDRRMRGGGRRGTGLVPSCVILTNKTTSVDMVVIGEQQMVHASARKCIHHPLFDRLGRLVGWLVGRSVTWPITIEKHAEIRKQSWISIFL